MALRHVGRAAVYAAVEDPARLAIVDARITAALRAHEFSRATDVT
jgi:hypothetical protein